MKKNSKKMSLWLAAMAVSMAIVGCSNVKTSATTQAVETSAEADDTAEALATKTSTTTSTTYSKEDLNTSYSDSDTKIELSGETASTPTVRSISRAEV